MLCRYKIELRTDMTGVRRSLIPREELADWKQADELLRCASAQADELINQAQKKCEALQEETSLAIWQRADVQLKRWEQDRQAMCDRLEHYATAITNQAIGCLLDETAPPQRLAAILKQLLANQIPEIEATLLCHPQDADEIKQHLAQHKGALWRLHADDTLPPQTLVLNTDEGDFHISWHSMLATFFSHDKEQQGAI